MKIKDYTCQSVPIFETLFGTIHNLKRGTYTVQPSARQVKNRGKKITPAESFAVVNYFLLNLS
jgi:hypothetical protein